MSDCDYRQTVPEAFYGNRDATHVVIARKSEQPRMQAPGKLAGSIGVALRKFVNSFIAILIASLGWHLYGYAQVKPQVFQQGPRRRLLCELL